jgi:hypothetical protein
VLLIVDALDEVCVLLTEPKDGEYTARRTARFGEPIVIPIGDTAVRLPTGNL